MRPRLRYRAPSFYLLILLPVLAFIVACGGGDDDAGGSPTSQVTGASAAAAGANRSADSSVRMLGAVISNQITENREPAGFVSRAFPIETSRIYAVMALEGVEPGAEVVGRWYQLSIPDGPPDGTEVSASTITLDEASIVDGRSGVALELSAGEQNLPPGDWLVRIYVDGVFLRTMAFVITDALVVLPQPTPGANGQPAPQPTIISAGEYTVEAGDSLLTIGEKLKAPNESTELFLSRLIELNGIEPGSSLLVGQVLQIPAPP